MPNLPPNLAELRKHAAALAECLDRADAAIGRIGRLQRNDAIRRASDDAVAAGADAAFVLNRIDDFCARRGGGVTVLADTRAAAFAAISDAVTA